jgi:hypothetical protein
MENDFHPPLFDEVKSYFLEKLKDKQVAESMAKRFFLFYDKNGWVIKVSAKKHTPMKSWKGTINTWIKNMPKYSKTEVIQIASNKLFNES